MEKFYYDQNAEFRRVRFHVETYGDVVKCVREADDERLRVFLSKVLPPDVYDATDEANHTCVQFTVGLHPQDYKRYDAPPLHSAKNPTGFAWQATMLSARSSPAHVVCMMYILFPVRGVYDVKRRNTQEPLAKIQITDDCLYDDVCV